MTPPNKMRANVVAAVCAGLALRVYLVLKFPVTDTGDGPFYIELAWNWLKNGVFGFAVHGQLTPVDMRVPGYPAFLAAVFAVAGQSPRAAMLAQVVVDLATCFVVALIAARLAPEKSRRRVALAGLWLGALFLFPRDFTAGGIWDFGAAGNSVGIVCGGFGAGGEVVAADGLDETDSRRAADGAGSADSA